MTADVAGAAGHPRRPGPLVATATWADLAGNRPGSRAEERARLLRRASPIKTTLGRLLHIGTEEAAARLGAVAERKVGAMLSRLDSSWRVVHAIPIRADQSDADADLHADIDHVVIGPPGVFTLTTAYRRGALVQVFADLVRVDACQESYAVHARHEAWRAACLLTAACGYRIVVSPAVVFVGAEDVCVARPAEGVEILDRRHLLRWLNGLPARLKPAHVAHIYTAARRSDTWMRAPVTTRRAQQTG